MESATGKIEEIQSFRLKMPLNVPYHLSLGEVKHFDLFLVRTRVEGVEGIGETVPLPGYSKETGDSVWELLREWNGRLPGMEAGEALRKLASVRNMSPFATTAIASAIETATHPLYLSEEIRVPLLGTVMDHSEEGLEDEVESLLRKGYTTLKVKVGWDERNDVSRVRRVQEIVGEQAMIRVDANQAYDLDQALHLVHHVDPGNIELFEQPFPAGDWENMVRLSRESPLPLMLDESIDSMAELEKMIRLRCAGVVKFKLMKAGALAELESLILRAGNAGLKVVLGNGVAGDIGNFHELVLAGQLVEAAGEMNGFLKQEGRLLSNPYDVSRGKVTLPAGYVPQPDWCTVQSYVVESVQAGGVPLKTKEI